MTLAGKTAVVTGGSRGIGRAIVRRLAADGARVVFSFRDDKAAADALAREIGGAVAVRADQEDLGNLDALFEPIDGGLDILVNNAAITAPAPISEITPELFDQAMTVNAKFPLLAMQRAAPLLRDGGRIISISTLNTAAPGPGIALYCASKAALEQFTKVAAYEFGRRASRSTPSRRARPTPTCCAQAIPRNRLRRPPRSLPWAGWARPPTSRTWSPSWPAPTPGGSPARTSRPPAASTSDPGPSATRTASTQRWRHPGSKR